MEMAYRLDVFNENRDKQGKKTLKIGIGLHSDEVVSGNIGSSKRMELTSIGDGVNLASRLEGTSKMYGCVIVISEKTYEACKDRILVRELDFITVKGKTEPVRIYELVGIKEGPLAKELDPKKQELIDAYHQGRKYYLESEFELAMAEFAKVQEIDPDNKAANLHVDRCLHFLQEPHRLTGMVFGG